MNDPTAGTTPRRARRSRNRSRPRGGGCRRSRPDTRGTAQPARRCDPRGRRAQSARGNDPAVDQAPHAACLQGRHRRGQGCVGSAHRPPVARAPDAAGPGPRPGPRHDRQPGAARARATRAPRASGPCGPAREKSPGTRLALVVVAKYAAARPEHHRTMPLDQGRERQLGGFAVISREPLEQLPVGQARGDPRVEQRPQIPPGNRNRLARHRLAPITDTARLS